MENEKIKFVTLEGKSGVNTEADVQIANAALTGQGLVQIKPEDLMKLAEAAKETNDWFLEEVIKLMTKEKAEYVRKIRCDEGYTWRAVAQACYDEWKGDWSPPSNQIMGMALCEIAAGFFGEKYMEEPWN
jgi:hypothetical protein